MTATQRRGPWSTAEDQYLMELVERHGAYNWVQISGSLTSRTPKQCRERYHQNLKPSLNHDPITPEEGQEIEHLVQTIGKRWAEIARRLKGRSDNAVKNWWNGSQNRRKRQDRRRAAFDVPHFHHQSQHQPTPQQYQQQHHQYHRSPLTITPPGPAYMGSQISPQASHANMYHHAPRTMGSTWEPPLPSPCSSESAESDVGSNYTTSPARPPTHLHSRVELPPLRTEVPPSGPRLPSFSSLSSLPNSIPGAPPSRRSTQGQLPTAPSSPALLQQSQYLQQQRPLQQHPYSLQSSQHSSGHNDSPLSQDAKDKDSRMKLASLLV